MFLNKFLLIEIDNDQNFPYFIGTRQSGTAQRWIRYPSSVKQTLHCIIETPPTVVVVQVLHPFPVLEHLTHVFPLVR